MSKEQYLMNYTKEQLAAKLAELDKKYRRERPVMRLWQRNLLQSWGWKRSVLQREPKTL